MSVVAKRIGMGSPREIAQFSEYYTTSGFIEASPIYTSVQVTVGISGSYTSGGFDYDYSYSKSKSWNRVPIVGDSATLINNLTSTEINGVSETSTGSVAAIAVIADSETYIALAPTVELYDSAEYVFDYLFNPKHSAGLILYNTGIIEDNAIVGTKTNTATMVVTDIIRNISTATPRFLFTSVDSRNISDVLYCEAGGDEFTALIQEDTTVWDYAKWRDYRGTYTGTNTDANGITTDIELVLA